MKKKTVALVSGIFVASLLAGWFIRQQWFPAAKTPGRFLQANHNVDLVRFSADGSYLLAAQSNGTGIVTMWDTAMAQQLKQWHGGGGKLWLADDNQRVLVSKYDDESKTTTCTLQSIKTGEVLRHWKVAGTVSEVSTDLSLLLSAQYFPGKKPSQRATISLQEISSGKVRGQFSTTNGWPIHFLNKQRYIGNYETSSPAQLLRVSDLKPVLPLPPLTSLRISSDGNRVIGLKEDGSLHLWQLPSRQHTSISTGLTRGRWLYSLKDGSIVICGEENKENRRQPTILVRSSNGQQLRYIIPEEPNSVSKTGNLMAIRVRRSNSAGNGYIETGFYDIWDVRTGKRVTRLDVSSDALGQPTSLRSDYQQLFAFDNNDRQVVYFQTDGLLRFFDLDKQQARVPGPVSTAPGRVTTDPLMLKLGEEQKKLNLTGIINPLKKQIGQQKFRLEMEVPSPDGQKTVRVWNGVQEKVENKKYVSYILGTGLIEVIDKASGRQLKILESPEREGGAGMSGSLGSPVWSKDATKLAMDDQRGRVFIWDVLTGKQITQLSGTRAEVNRTSSPFASQLFNEAARLAFHPNGRFLAAAREDGSIYLYSLESRLPVAQLGQARMQLWWMEFSPDGKTISGIPVNSTTMFSWDVPSEYE